MAATCSGVVRDRAFLILSLSVKVSQQVSMSSSVSLRTRSSIMYPALTPAWMCRADIRSR